MFERFTYEARRVVVTAQDEAWTLGHDRIGPGWENQKERKGNYA